jgi:hypothetical protein
LRDPYTIALSHHLATPGLDVRRAFGFVRDDVLKSTDNRQEPFIYGSLGGEDVPLVPVKAAPSASPAPPQAEMRRDYELALQIGNKEAFNFFLTSIRTVTTQIWQSFSWPKLLRKRCVSRRPKGCAHQLT